MKVVIIGAGLLGVTSAYFLAREGHDVVVLDRQEGPAQETSFANAGMLTPAMTSPWNSPGILSTFFKNVGRKDSPFLLRLKAIPSLCIWGILFLLNANEKKFLRSKADGVNLSLYSLKVMKKIREELDIKYKQIITGSCKIFYDQKSFDDYSEYVKLLDQHGIKYDVVSPDRMVEIEPSLKPIKDKLCGGVFFPGDEAGDAYEFTCMLEKETIKLGAQFHYGIDVKSIEANSQKISKIITPEDDFVADIFVLCAGSFSHELAKLVNVNIPVKPVKGYSISIPMEGFNNAPKMTVVDDHFHSAITPLGDVLRVTAAAEFTGYDDSLDQQQINQLYHLSQEIFPGLKPLLTQKDITQWCGFRPMSVDGNPYIGKTNLNNLFLNTGHGSFGWTMAAGSAKILADIIVGNTPEIDASPYTLDR